jgi:hypothetical protein
MLIQLLFYHFSWSKIIYYFMTKMDMGWDSSVGIVTCYGLDGPGIESQWGPDFPHPSRLVLGPTQPPLQWVPSHSQGKAAGVCC